MLYNFHHWILLFKKPINHLFESLCSLVFTVFVIYVVMIWCKNGVWQNIYCHGTDLTISSSLQHKQEKGCQLGFLLELLFEDAAALNESRGRPAAFFFIYPHSLWGGHRAFCSPRLKICSVVLLHCIMKDLRIMPGPLVPITGPSQALV